LGEILIPFGGAVNKLTIEDLSVKGKRVFLRVDFNVPLKNGVVKDDTRIRAALPTITYLQKHGAKIILVSHLGRPDGQRAEEYSLRPVAAVLESLLGQPVSFSPDLLGPVAETAINCLKEGHCLLMENIRFYPEETENDAQFSRELASLADLYVMDAFGTCHRAHASTYGVAKHFKNAACGYLMQKELEYLGSLLTNPKRPFVTITGGAKVSDKVELLSNMLDIADHILIGGAMAYSFLKVLEVKVGNSRIEADKLDLVQQILDKAKRLGKGLHLPVDHVVATEFNENSAPKAVEGDIPEGYMGLDIGPKTAAKYSQLIGQAQSLFWNGPMGVFEWPNFKTGTMTVAQAVANNPGITVIGGGDSVTAINMAGLADKISHISTGGGASLEFMQGNPMPGVEALAERN